MKLNPSITPPPTKCPTCATLATHAYNEREKGRIDYLDGNVAQVGLGPAELGGGVLDLIDEGLDVTGLLDELGGVLLPTGREVRERLGHPLLTGQHLLRLGREVAQEVHVVLDAMLNDHIIKIRIENFLLEMALLLATGACKGPLRFKQERGLLEGSRMGQRGINVRRRRGYRHQ
jgi:hypothetical protein